MANRPRPLTSHHRPQVHIGWCHPQETTNFWVKTEATRSPWYSFILCHVTIVALWWSTCSHSTIDRMKLLKHLYKMNPEPSNIHACSIIQLCCYISLKHDQSSLCVWWEHSYYNTDSQRNAAADCTSVIFMSVYLPLPLKYRFFGSDCIWQTILANIII